MKQQETAALNIYETFWGGLLRADIDIYEANLDENYRLIGTTEMEVFFTKGDAVNFLKATADQIAGNLERRNSKINLEVIDGFILITEQFDAYVRIDGEWSFYGKTRVSTWMQEKPEGWKLIQQHYSFPDAKAEKGYTVGLEKIAKENLELRDAIKRRTIELEQKNRELEIEAALERVRSRAMAMHDSGELSDLVANLLRELTRLDFSLTFCIINIYNEPDNSNMVWAANPEEGKAPESYYMKFEDYPFHHAMMREWKAQTPKFVYVMEGEEKMIYDDYLYSETEFRRFPEEVQIANRALEKYVATFVFSHFGGLQTVGTETLSDESIDILYRFGKVFDLTYTRFNDLKKAEAQAKEAQIEASLERIRARALAMHKSEEFTDVAKVMREQMGYLGQPELETSAVHLYNEDADHIFSWRAFRLSSKSEGNITYGFFKIPKTSCDIAREFVQKFESKDTYYTIEVSGVKQTAWYKILFKLAPEVADAMKRSGTTKEKRYYHFSKFTGGALLMVSSKEPASDSVELQKRAALVFDLAYRRFKDLQNAEAQARESQIQLALERVRARTMAMQKSDELFDVAHMLHEQFTYLGETTIQMTIGIANESGKCFDTSVTDWSGKGNSVFTNYQIPFNEPSLFKDIYNKWKKNLPSIVIELKGERLKKWVAYRNKISGVKVSTEKPRIITAAFFSKGFIAFSKYETSNMATVQLLERFASVFDQTYTRFLDLQKAEAQAREAQIEAGLERVRSRTMAMQHSSELSETSALLFKQIKTLGVPPWSCGFNIWEQGDTVFTSYMGSPDGTILDGFEIPLTEEATFIHFQESRDRGDRLFVDVLQGETLEEHYRYFFTLPGIKEAFEKRAQLGEQRPTFQINHLANFSHGNLMFITYEPCPEAHDIFIRFAKVFEQTYTRFLDLQRAEAQAREAQIEAALERVRSRAMAMHKSDELLQVIETLSEQLRQLGLHAEAVSFLTDGDEKGYNMWLSSPGEEFLSKIFVPRIQDRTTLLFLEAKENGKKYYSYVLSKTEKDIYFQNFFNNTVLRDYPDNGKEQVFAAPGMTTTNVLLDSIILSVSNFDTLPYNDHENEIINRIATVFQQTYTRFLDLQRAEAQAREAQIEAALERVRARTMAMHSSEDVSTATATMFAELEKLGIENIRGGITIISPDQMQEVWSITNQDDGNTIRSIGIFDMRLHPFWQEIFRGWNNKELFQHYWLEGNEKEDYLSILNATHGYLSQPIDEIPDVHIQSYFFGEGAVWANSIKPHSEEDKQIMKRFASVFSLTFRRYRDLQKAETQAREAQIEAALEKVRSRTMAMQSSNELQETAAVLFQEFKKLGADDMQQFTIGIYNEEERVIDFRVTSWSGGGEKEDRSFRLDMDEPSLVQPAVAAWKAGKKSAVFDLTGEALQGWLNYRNKISGITLKSHDTGGRRVITAAYFSKGHLSISTFVPLADETIKTLERFASVFDGTYTRFLDLEKAEAQAREATIEASLERVRGKAMAMHSSNDISATIQLVFEELKKLGIQSFRSGVGLINKGTRKMKFYSAGTFGGDENDHVQIVLESRLEGHELLKAVYDKWINQEDYFYVLKGRELIAFYETLKIDSPVAVINNENYEQYGYSLPFAEGVLYGWSEQPFTEGESKILKRFKTVVALTFRRYIELQQAEANALDALRSASLDRVRAEIASMRSKQDLERITPLIWKELTTLGIPFVRCGVFIMDEQEELIHTFLSTPDGKAIAAFHVPYGSTPLAGSIEFWRERKMYITHWGINEYAEFADAFIDKNDTEKRAHYLSSVPNEGIHLHLLPFLQGMLYVGNHAPLQEDNLDLIQSVADAFSTAYARYEDFNKLEAAKKQVENALQELKVTQKQLIQSEKMASLGELTAGIAHEIQNPLNFVNNFSEVSKELIDEVKSERSKMKSERDEELEEELLNDIAKNLEKINHHGKRADAIVKGMLQHSRTSTGQMEPADINALCDEYLRLAYHGLKAREKSFEASFRFEPDYTIPKINVVPQDIGRVLLNLINNAFQACTISAFSIQHSELNPLVTVSTKKLGDRIEISVKDNGPGIPDAIKDKIFQPFFTTKPTGQGTGLGLSLSYDIVKAHGGEIKMDTAPGTGSVFTILLPL